MKRFSRTIRFVSPIIVGLGWSKNETIEAFVIFAQAFRHFSIFGQRRDNVYDNGTRGKHGNCLGERNECRVSRKLKLQGKGGGGRGKRRSIVQVEQIKLAAFAGQKQSPNLISHRAFKLSFVDSLGTTWSKKIERKKKENEILPFRMKKKKNESNRVVEEIWTFAYGFLKNT